jgi:ankyrin repeat protein
MSIYIPRDIEGINYITNSLNNYPVLNESRLNKLISNIDKSLNNLQFHIKDGLTHLTEEWKPQIIESLQELDKIISKINQEDEQNITIRSIHDKILNIQAAVKTTCLFDVKKQYSNIIPIIFFCDLDAPDHNHAIINRVERAIEQGGPLFITTRSLLRGEGLESGLDEQLLKSEKLLNQHSYRWEIYEKGDLLIFIPSALFPDKKGIQRLQALDFKVDENIKQIDFREALNPSQQITTIQDFIDLFNEQPQTKTFFMLNGHGGPDTVGALNEKNYLKFLNFLDPHCKGLATISCSSGGVSSLLNIPETQTSPNFFDQEKPHSFPKIVCSIGDFTTHSQPVEKQLMVFMNELCKFTESSKGQTVEELRNRIEGLEGGKETEATCLIKLYPAHSSGVPGGFRPIGEGSKSFNITYAEVKKAGLNIVTSEKGSRVTTKEPEIIVPLQTEFLLINPLVIQVSITFKGKNPLLISMIPGTGHHFIKSLKLAESEPADHFDFIKKTLEFYANKSNQLTYGCKGIFISEMCHKDKKIHDIIFNISSKEARCGWREGTKYYLTTLEGFFSIREVSWLDYAVFCYETNLQTKGLEKAIRTTSAGLENESLFQEAFKEANFYPKEFHTLFDLSQTPPQPIIDLLEYLKKQDSEFQCSIVSFLTKYGNAPLALKLFNEYKLFGHNTFKDITGNTILSYAIQAYAADLVEESFRHGMNVLNTNGDPPLHQTLKQLVSLYEKRKKGISNEHSIEECERILDYLLDNKCQVNAKNLRGWPAIAIALRHPQLVEKLIQHGASLNEVNTKNGSTLLDLSVSRSDSESIDWLLELGVVPDPKALNLTIKSKDVNLLKKLLTAGGNPFEIDSKGKVPFIEAILLASPEVVKLLLKMERCDVNVKDKNGLTPLMAAFIVGDPIKLQMLKEKNAEIPDLSKAKSSLEAILARNYVQSQDVDSFKEILSYPHQDDFEIFVGDYLLKIHDTNILKELIEADSLNVTFKDSDGKSLFDKIYKIAEEDDSYDDLIRVCLNSKQEIPLEKTLSQAIKSYDDPLIKMLVNAFDFSKSENPDKLFGELIKFNDLTFIQIAVEKGASVNGKGTCELLPLQHTKCSFSVGKKVFKWLVEQGADLNIPGKDNKNSFCHAIIHGDLELVDFCLENGAKVTQESESSPLMIAASRLKDDPSGQDPSIKIFKLLLEHAQGEMNPSLIHKLCFHEEELLNLALNYKTSNK